MRENENDSKQDGAIAFESQFPSCEIRIGKNKIKYMGNRVVSHLYSIYLGLSVIGLIGQWFVLTYIEK